MIDKFFYSCYLKLNHKHFYEFYLYYIYTGTMLKEFCRCFFFFFWIGMVDYLQEVRLFLAFSFLMDFPQDISVCNIFICRLYHLCFFFRHQNYRRVTHIISLSSAFLFKLHNFFRYFSSNGYSVCCELLHWGSEVVTIFLPQLLSLFAHL